VIDTPDVEIATGNHVWISWHPLYRRHFTVTLENRTWFFTGLCRRFASAPKPMMSLFASGPCSIRISLSNNTPPANASIARL